MGRSSFIFELCPFRNYRKQFSRSTAGFVHTGFPFADGLLAGAQLFGHLILRQFKMGPQSMDFGAVPPVALAFLFVSHTQIIHGLV